VIPTSFAPCRATGGWKHFHIGCRTQLRNSPPHRKWESAYPCNSVEYHRRQYRDRTVCLCYLQILCYLHSHNILWRHPMLSYAMSAPTGTETEVYPGHSKIEKLRCQPTTNQLRNTCESSQESLRTRTSGVSGPCFSIFPVAIGPRPNC
jgi:hypothetical protein